MVIFYSICTIIVLVMLALSLVMFKEKKINFYVAFIFFIMLLSSIGYLTISISTTTSEAILGTKLSYLGGCFISPMSISIICVICNYKLKPWHIGLIYFPCLFLFCSVLTIGYTDFYYVEEWLINNNKYSILGHEYGIGHNFYYAILVFYTIVAIVMITYTIKIKKAVSKKDVYLLSFLLGVNTLTSILNSILKIDLELAPIMYIIDGITLIFINLNSHIYNIEDSLSSYIINNKFNYILLNKNLKYIGSSNNVANIFPKLKNEKINHKLSLDFINVYEWIDKFKLGNNNFTYNYDNKIYTCSIYETKNKNKITGYVISLTDETDKNNYLNLLERYNTQLQDEVSEKTSKIERIQSQTLRGMATIIEGRDENTGGHIKRTSDIIEILVAEIKKDASFNYSDDYYEAIIKAAPLHDLGKVSIDDKILKKPERLTNEEFEIIKSHSTISAEMIKEMFKEDLDDNFVKIAINVARYHHEKYDGKGYPEGLKGEGIPFEARVMAVADVYDALVSKRCYKEPMSFSDAYDEIIKSMGSHFDPKLKNIFINSVKRLEEYYKSEE